MPPEAELPPVLARAQRSFSQTCGVAQPDGTCKALLAVVHRFAAFQKRVFAPDTPCSERRVLVIRESFSDAVGVGHLHNGFVRFLALALAMGRALVFSACTSDADPWAVRGERLWKNAQPFDCGRSHLSVAEYYEGLGGIDFQWSAERQRRFAACGVRETTLDLMARSTLTLAQGQPAGQAANEALLAGLVGPREAFRRAADRMDCDHGAKARCPDWRALFAEGGPMAANFSAAPLLALYNPRRDGGAHGLPRLQLELGNGVAVLPAPNGSTLGLAPAAQLRDTLLCPLRCLAHVTFTPGVVIRRILHRVVGDLRPSQPLLCAHLRTMWVDDGRCFPNPRGCQRKDWHLYFHTHNVSSSGRDPASTHFRRPKPHLAFDERPDHVAETSGRRSPLWWQLDMPAPLLVCRIVVLLPRPALGAAFHEQGAALSAALGRPYNASAPSGPTAGGGSGDVPAAGIPRGLQLVLLRADGSEWRAPAAAAVSSVVGSASPSARRAVGGPFRLEWRVAVLAGGGGVRCTSVRLELPFEPSAHALPAAPALLRLRKVEMHTDEPLSWEVADRHAQADSTCALLQWRGNAMSSCTWGGGSTAQRLRQRPPASHGLMHGLVHGRRLASARAAREGANAPPPRRRRGSSAQAKGAGAARRPLPAQPKRTMLEAVGGWSGFVRCMFEPAVRARLLADAAAPRSPRRNGTALHGGAGGRTARHEATFISTDAPALQSLIAESFPRRARFVGGGKGGEPAASWEAGLAEESYAKALADFEVLKHCDVIVGPVSSSYAKTAAFESMRVRRLHSQRTLGVCPDYHRMGAATRPAASRFGLEQCQSVHSP